MEKRYYIRICKREDDIGLIRCGADGFTKYLGRYTCPEGKCHDVLTMEGNEFSPDEIEEIWMNIEDTFLFEVDCSSFYTSTRKPITIEIGEKNKWQYTPEHIEKWDKKRKEEYK